MKNIDWRPLAAAAALLLTSACGRANRGAGINLSGSTSVSPFAEHLGELYHKQHPETHINVQSLGSSAGIQAAIDGVAEIGMSSRELKPEEAAKLDELVIARDALAVIVHPSNPVHDLTQEQVRAIFGGSITNWRDVGGEDRSITLVAREAGSGTYSAFQELMLGKQTVTNAALRQGSNGAIRQVVAEDAGAIGYISLGIVDTSVRAISIGGVAATHDTGIEDSYKFVRNFLFVWPKGEKLPADAQAFIDYVLSDEGQAEFENLGLIRVKVTTQAK